MAKKYENGDDEEAFRDMNEYDSELLKKFESNDQEIDDMLDKVIEGIEILKGHAQNIHTAILT